MRPFVAAPELRIAVLRGSYFCAWTVLLLALSQAHVSHLGTMGVSQSSFNASSPPKGEVDSKAEGAGAAESAEFVVTLRAKTTCKRTRAIKNKKASFTVTRAGTVIGTTGADVVIDDSYLSPDHCVIRINEAGNVELVATNRTYWLIGQGMRTTGMHKLEVDQVVKMGACSLQVTETRVGPTDRTPDKLAADSTATSDVCYICFDDSSESALVPSPCTCHKLVHRECLGQWIATRGSRLCSICKDKLPIDFTVDPPYVVLQVVRHMRGLHWSGEREYIISYSQRMSNVVTVGSGQDCDLNLPDPSLSRVHARIVHADNAFHVEDLSSSAGTFLKLVKPHELPQEEIMQFKIGRTMMSLRVKKKRTIFPWKR